MTDALICSQHHHRRFVYPSTRLRAHFSSAPPLPFSPLYVCVIIAADIRSNMHPCPVSQFPSVCPNSPRQPLQTLIRFLIFPYSEDCPEQVTPPAPFLSVPLLRSPPPFSPSVFFSFCSLFFVTPLDDSDAPLDLLSICLPSNQSACRMGDCQLNSSRTEEINSRVLSGERFPVCHHSWKHSCGRALVLRSNAAPSLPVIFAQWDWGNERLCG